MYFHFLIIFLLLVKLRSLIFCYTFLLKLKMILRLIISFNFILIIQFKFIDLSENKIIEKRNSVNICHNIKCFNGTFQLLFKSKISLSSHNNKI